MELNTLILLLQITVFAIGGIAFIWYARNNRKQLEQQAITIKRLQENQQHHLQLVESTLSPHLFKNILNSIQSHAYQTYFALDKLANVLDYILYDSRQPYVSAKEEIEFAKNLIEINKIKLSPLFELQVKTKIDEQDDCYLQKVMAPLIAIDLIENAFKHADIQSQDSFIKIVIELQGGIFSLTVANKISERPRLPKQKSGIGTKTLEQRLQLIYGNHYSLERIQQNDQYIAQLKISLREYENKMRSAG